MDLFFVSVLGILVGSFLTVVTYRTPKMMHEDTLSAFNLLYPRSHCPQCQTQLKISSLIPIISYFWLGGRCATCKHPIAIRYCVIEIITLLCSICAYLCLQITFLDLVIGLIFTWGLIAIATIDFEHYLIPDLISLPWLWLGLILSAFNLLHDPRLSILGASVGYLSFWIISKTYKKLTGRTGLGHGDFKCLAMLGAWVGVDYLPIVVFCAATLGLIIGLIFLLRKKIQYYTALPFGPFLVFSGWCIFLWEKHVTNSLF